MQSFQIYRKCQWLTLQLFRFWYKHTTLFPRRFNVEYTLCVCRVISQSLFLSCYIYNIQYIRFVSLHNIYNILILNEPLLMIYFRKRDGRIYKNEFKMGCNKLLYVKNVRIRSFSLSICFLVFVQEIFEGWEHNGPPHLGSYYTVLHCCNTIFFLFPTMLSLIRLLYWIWSSVLLVVNGNSANFVKFSNILKRIV